jgi:oxaloacetate decarboxylase gamma subunit
MYILQIFFPFQIKLYRFDILKFENMSEEMSAGVTLLLIGMVTVGLVLALVVSMGNLLIRLVNLLPEAESQVLTRRATEEVPPNKIAAITAAINIFTQGKARITSIEKHVK